jgi:hypothetical protein
MTGDARLRSLVATNTATSAVAPPTATVPRAERSLAKESVVVLDSADALIARDSSVRLVTAEVVPDWLELIGPGLWYDPNTWRPLAVVFE